MSWPPGELPALATVNALVRRQQARLGPAQGRGSGNPRGGADLRSGDVGAAHAGRILSLARVQQRASCARDESMIDYD